ncbi:MAG: hypothetical protein ABIP78_00380, partial [Pyrinomonadaceae bacterium]
MYKKYILCMVAGLAASLAAGGSAIAQDPTPTPTKTTTTVTTKTTKTMQNPDGSYTVIEYPENKEVIVDLTPTSMLPGASGRARIMRQGMDTVINLDLTGMKGDLNSYNLYAIDPMGKVTSLGPVSVNDGIGTMSVKTPLDKFMLVLSPEAN